jgi:hypothetical protein
VTQTQLAIDIINWGINVAFVSSILFPVAIRPIWAWTESAWGWNTIAFDVVVALALLPVWLHRTFNLNPGSLMFLWIQAASLCAIPVIIIWRTWIIWRVQRHGR